MEYEIYKPFVLNRWKHHKDFICRQINLLSEAGSGSLPKLMNEIKQIGNSQTDIYLGTLSPQEIVGEISTILSDAKRIDKDQFFIWLKTSKSLYKQITVSDGSAWTLRFGNIEDRYIHIHPGRYSPFTRRVRATILKTAVAALEYAKIYNVQVIDVKIINKVRCEFLFLPPVKTLEACSGLASAIDLLQE